MATCGKEPVTLLIMIGKCTATKPPPAPGFVAVAGEKIVGSILSCRRRFRLGDQISWSLERGDAMTHPDYRRQGMWRELMARLSAAGDQIGGFPVMGFPAPEPFIGHRKKFSQQAFLRVWRMGLPLSPAAIRIQTGMPALPAWLIYRTYAVCRSVWGLFHPVGRKLQVEKVTGFAGWADQLWQMESTRAEAGVVKDADYLEWRFGSNPDSYTIYRAATSTGEPLGFLVAKERSRSDKEVFGMVADLMVPSRRTPILNRLLKAAVCDFRARGIILVDAWVSPAPFYRRGLLNFGFLPVKRHPLVVLEKHAEHIRKIGWGDPRRWVIMMADSDNI